MTGPASGRPAVTTRAALARCGLQLFLAHGFTAVTVDQIAAAVGIGRRTFFRYFASKNDLVWGEFDQGLADLRASLAAADPAAPMLEVLRGAILAFNSFHDAELPLHRERMRLIIEVPALQAHGTLRYAAWRAVVAEYAAARLGLPAGDLQPQLVAHLHLAAALTAYEQWLARPDADLARLLLLALGALEGQPR